MECGGLPPLLDVKLASRPFSEASFGKKAQASLRTPK
jgi:hypothetical protein